MSRVVKVPLLTVVISAYQNLDFILQSDSVRFPELRSPHYVTNMPRMLDRPTQESESPELLDVKQIDQEAVFKFSSRNGMAAL